MISLNTINQINDIMTILSNTRKALTKPQQGSNLDNELQQDTVQQTTVQTPAQTVQQMTVKPNVNRKPIVVKKCKYCNKDVTGDVPFCDESHASMYRLYGPRRQ